jgi:hypothetical protein
VELDAPLPPLLPPLLLLLAKPGADATNAPLPLPLLLFE